MDDRPSQLDLPANLATYLEQHQTFTLATASPTGIPRASTFLYVNDGPTLYFWSRATTATARHIEQNPVVSFTVDEYAEDLNQTRGVQGTGECSVLLSGEQIARVADLFGQKFPSLSPGSTTSLSFYRISSSELQFIDNTVAAVTARSEGAFGAEFHRDRSYSVITELPVQVGERIVVTLQTIEVSAGETIVRQGGPADRFLIVVEGEADVVRDEHGTETPITTLNAGELFGEVAIMRDEPRTSTVRARTETRLFALERDTFRDLIAQSLEIAPDFDQLIRSRLDAQGAT